MPNNRLTYLDPWMVTVGWHRVIAILLSCSIHFTLPARLLPATVSVIHLLFIP